MPRPSQLHGPRQVVGDAAPQGLLHLWPGAPCGDGPAKPAFDDRHACLGCPPLAIGFPGTGPLELAAVGMARQAMRWPSRNGGKDAREAQVFSPPAVVGLGIVAGIGQQTCTGQAGQGLFHEGAKFPLVPSWPAVSSLSTPDSGVGPHRHRPLQPGPGPVAFPSPVLVVGARLLPREARGIHRHGTGARRTMVPDQAHRCGQHARQQPRLHLVAWEPPPRRMVRHRAQREGGPEFLSARQQRFSPPLVPVSILYVM